MRKPPNEGFGRCSQGVLSEPVLSRSALRISSPFVLLKLVFIVYFRSYFFIFGLLRACSDPALCPHLSGLSPLPLPSLTGTVCPFLRLFLFNYQFSLVLCCTKLQRPRALTPLASSLSFLPLSRPALISFAFLFFLLLPTSIKFFPFVEIPRSKASQLLGFVNR